MSLIIRVVIALFGGRTWTTWVLSWYLIISIHDAPPLVLNLLFTNLHQRAMDLLVGNIGISSFNYIEHMGLHMEHNLVDDMLSSLTSCSSAGVLFIFWSKFGHPRNMIWVILVKWIAERCLLRKIIWIPSDHLMM